MLSALASSRHVGFHRHHSILAWGAAWPLLLCIISFWLLAVWRICSWPDTIGNAGFLWLWRQSQGKSGTCRLLLVLLLPCMRRGSGGVACRWCLTNFATADEGNFRR